VLGLTVLSEMRRANVDAPVVMVTGWYVDQGHEAAAQALGAAAFRHKPIDGEDLATTLRSAISVRSLPRVAAPCFKAVTRDKSTRVPMPDRAVETDAMRALHLDLLSGEEAAAHRIFAIVVPSLHRALSTRFGRVPWDWLHDAAVDALLDYYRRPERFDPKRGVPLRKWLEYPARRNLLNRLALERRRRDHETKVSESELEACPAPNASHDFDLDNYLRSILPDCTAAEYAALRLWICGERRTAVFAREAGADGLPSLEQRGVVKRLKDRLLKRLRRQSRASDARIYR
jgi:CheY-like chemotaxis protein